MPHSPSRRRHQAGFLLGFALGGFFDGILLHQILQWHHLLSAVEHPALLDLRAQVLADGVFHLLMYLIALAGLWLLWRSRGAGTGALPGWALIGFGAWHILDAVLSHWLLGLHRIRMDTDHPLAWDLLWFFVFGVAVVALGEWLRRHPPGRTGAGALAAAVLIAGPLAALPPPGADATLVVFRPGVDARQALEAIIAVDGGALWSDPAGAVWAVRLRDPDDGRRLYRHGALLVSNSWLGGGCLAWSR